MHPSNRIVNGLWIGSYLDNLELLTLSSFVRHGHTFHLWIYEKLQTPIPKGVILKDANAIIPEAEIFYYQHGEKSGLGKGSVAGFSDIFRYKLLYEKGGWWVDMDVTCLKPFDFSAPYVFRAHDFLPVVGNIMKCPPNSPLLAKCYEEARKSVTAENINWLQPIQILNDFIAKYQLTPFVHPGIANQDRWERIVLFRTYAGSIPKNCYALHWMNEEWRKNKFDKGSAAVGSIYEKLLDAYDLPHQKYPARRKDWYYFYLHFRAVLIPLLPRRLRIFLKKHWG